MPKIFISYRRDDASGHAGRLYDYLRVHFPDDEVLMDVDMMRPGFDFVDVLHEALSTTDIMLVVIGRTWLQASRSDGERRIDDPNDFVHLEVASALRSGTAVIPVLVQGAEMPSSRNLPEDLQPLARRQAAEVRDTRWRDDLDGLLLSIGRITQLLAMRAPVEAEPGPKPKVAEPVEAPQSRAAANEETSDQIESIPIDRSTRSMNDHPSTEPSTAVSPDPVAQDSTRAQDAPSDSTSSSSSDIRWFFFGLAFMLGIPTAIVLFFRSGRIFTEGPGLRDVVEVVAAGVLALVVLIRDWRTGASYFVSWAAIIAYLVFSDEFWRFVADRQLSSGAVVVIGAIPTYVLYLLLAERRS